MAERLALRPAELAQSLGVSVRLVRAQLRHIPHLRIGTALIFPTDRVREWLAEQAAAQATEAEVVAGAILADLRRSSKSG